MTDHSELKRLADAFPADLDFDSNTEPFFNGPSGESLGGGSTGFYSVYGKPFLIEGDDYEYDGPTYVEACNADFAKFMVAAREGVLALIVEIEALKSSHEQIFENYNKASYASEKRGEERDQLKSENKRLSELLECSQGDMRTADKIIEERDRLLSMFDCPDHGHCVPYAMKQVEALRKDAERYRFLKSRTQQADIELAVCLHDKRTQATVFLDGEYVDSLTDIAMSKGAKP